MVSRRNKTINNRRTRKCGYMSRKRRNLSRSRMNTKYKRRRQKTNSKSRISGGRKNVFIITAFGSALNKNTDDMYRKVDPDSREIENINFYKKPENIVTTITRVNVEEPVSILENMSNNFVKIDEFLERGKRGIYKKTPETPIYREIIEVENRIPNDENKT